MISVCPNCHDDIHYGRIEIDDEALYQWKSLQRKDGTIRDLIYVEPGATCKLLFGSIAVTTPRDAVVFRLSQKNDLRLKIEDDDILLMDLRVSSLSGKEVFRVTSNHIRCEPASDLEYRRVTGHFQLITKTPDDYLPKWAISQMRRDSSDFALDDRLILVDLRVLKPGLVQVQGVWAARDKAIVITSDSLSFLHPSRFRPVSLVGNGEDSVLRYHSGGVIDPPLFGFDETSTLFVGAAKLTRK